MKFFRRKQQESAPVPPDALTAIASALAQALASSVQMQTATTENYGKFLDKIGEVATRRAAQALGSRGGRKRAERAKAAQTCKLCNNRFATDITVADINSHREHERAAAAVQPKVQEQGN